MLVNPDSVVRVGTMQNDSSSPNYSYIRFSDGSSVDVAESYEKLKSILEAT